MPIQAQSADGQIHEFPDGTPDTVVDKVMKEYAAQTAPKQPNVAVDVAKSAVTGLGKAAAGVIGLPGDVKSIIDTGEQYLINQVGLGGAKNPVQSQIIQPPTSAQVGKVISAPFGGFHEPQTVPGQYAETIAEYAPAALSPGSALRKIARVVVPSVTSETAGQLTKGTPLEPYARLAGGVIGGIGQGLGEGILAERATSAAIPTTQDLKAAAQGAYRSAESQNLVISKGSFDNAVDQIAKDLESRGINPRIPPAAQARLYPKGSAALEILQASKGQDIGLSDLDKLRQVARVALESNDKADRSVAHSIIDGIDDFVSKLQPSDVVSGNAPAAVAAINDARANWTRYAKSEVINRALQKAEASKGQFTGAGYENALRVQFRLLAKNERAMRQFTPAEQEAIRRVEKGDVAANLARFIGKFSPHGVVGTLGGGALGYGAAGLPGAVAGLAVGEGGRQAATALTARNARLASEAVRSGVAPVRQLAAPVSRNALISATLSQPVNALNQAVPIGVPGQ